MRLERKVAIATGAARGIGLAIAQGFVAEGARVVLADWLEDEVRARAAALGPRALAVPADVGDARLFLASDEASYVTGTTIYADGGRLALNGVMPPAP